MSLVQLAIKRRIPIIEDDVYGDLQHEGHAPRCLKALIRRARSPVWLVLEDSRTGLSRGLYFGLGLFYDKVVH